MEWRDAGGAAVQNAVYGVPLVGPGSLSHLLYVDAGGNLWRLDPGTAMVGEAVPGPLELHFESSDCTGSARIPSPPIPRATFVVRGETAARVRRDDAAQMAVPLASRLGPNGCEPVDATEETVSLDQTVTVVPPILFYAAPLHPSL